MPLRHRTRYPELEEFYELHETLGSGGFAKVKAGIHRLTGEKVAVKIMDKEQLGADLPRVYTEIKALKKLHHQHICQLFHVIETYRMIYVILEFCPGGEVFDYIVAKERLKEREARSFFRQIISALHYTHEMGFIHRDLKPENLLLDEDSNIKLIDFGLVAEPQDTQDLLATCCGSPAYAAPELIRGGPYVGLKADVWSLGVLLYALLNGFLPFDDDHTPHLYRLIQRGVYEIPVWLSPGSIAILARVLQTDPERRISLEKLLRHPWVMDGYNKPVDWMSKIRLSELDAECVAELARYYDLSDEVMRRMVEQWKYDDVTATYFLLQQQKLHGKTPTIIEPPKSFKNSTTSVGTSDSSSSNLSPLATTTIINGSGASAGSLGGVEFLLSHKDKSSSDEDLESYHTPEDPEESSLTAGKPVGDNEDPSESSIAEMMAKLEIANEPPITPSPHRRMSIGQPMHPPMGEIQSLQKYGPIHPAIASIRDEDVVDPLYSSSPASFYGTSAPASSIFTFPRPLTPIVAHAPTEFNSQGFPTSPAMSFGRHKTPPTFVKERVKKTRSYDARLNHIVDQSIHTKSPLSPQLPKRGRLNSIVEKAKKVFKKEHSQGPRKVKGIYNVATTSTKPTDSVLLELERVLRQMSVQYHRENYTLHCRVPNYKYSAKVKKVDFDLEVCVLPSLAMIGIRRKRIRGDVWEYKRICDQIFTATKL